MPFYYIKQLAKFALNNDILICFDEVQGGFGRTGRMFAYQHYDVVPDLICLGKGISSSVPLSAVIGRKDILDIPEVGAMSSTHSANPIACATGLGVLKEIDNLIERANRLGAILIPHLMDMDLKVKGWGLMCAIHTKDVETADKICFECFKKGLLLIKTHKPSVKIAPPLTIKDAALLEGLDVIEEVIKNL